MWLNLVPRTSPLAFGHGGEDKKLKKKNEEEVVALQRAKRFNFNVLIVFFFHSFKEKKLAHGYATLIRTNGAVSLLPLFSA